jgi:E3 ubiquitin-protein ligase RNF217
MSKVNERRYPVFCPVCVAEQAAEPGGKVFLILTSCAVGDILSTVITDLLVRELGVPEESFLIWEELQLSAISILMHCRKYAILQLLDPFTNDPVQV